MLRFNCKTAVISACVIAASATVISVQTTDAGGFPAFVRSRTSVEKLAHKIDELQEEIDQLGTVVVKQPDVWGEARLTAHRVRFEELLKGEDNKFKETIQANLRRSDQAFLLQTLALQAALGGQQAILIDADGTKTPQSPPDGTKAPTLPANAPSLATAKTEIDLSNAEIVSSSKDATAQPGIALEPVIKLDQLSRYLNHLNQLRRINEGDDTADAPGYSMNLMRFPVSILPGTKTREGYGAEVTVTVTPRVSDKLLESTFQSLVINDLLDTLTLSILRMAQQRPELIAEQEKAIGAANREVERLEKVIEDVEKALAPENSEGLTSQIKEIQKEIDQLDEDRTELVKQTASNKKHWPVAFNSRETFKRFEAVASASPGIELVH